MEIQNEILETVKTLKDAVAGNTKLPPKKSIAWSFTYFNENLNLEKVFETVRRLGHLKCCVVGEEVCPLTGRIHYQGYVKFTIRKDFKFMKNNTWNEIHLEGSRGSEYQNWEYCTKDGKYLQWGDFDIPYTETPSIITTLYDWQEQLLDIIRSPVNDREVIWVYDVVGNKGKTAFGKYCLYYKYANYVKSGKKSDLAYIIQNKKIARDFIIDICRDNEEYVSYSFIEDLKDGVLFSPKFESTLKLITTPHVIIFSNSLPKFEKLSRDRWKILELRDNKLTEKSVFI